MSSMFSKCRRYLVNIDDIWFRSQFLGFLDKWHPIEGGLETIGNLTPFVRTYNHVTTSTQAILSRTPLANLAVRRPAWLK